MTDAKYSLAQLKWLAKRLTELKNKQGKSDRAAVIKEFNDTFPGVFLAPGKMAALYRNNGGSKDLFVKHYTDEDKALVARRDGIIARAIVEWAPEHASFANVYALAAKMVNQELQTAYRADDIETFIQKAGGMLELLFDCKVDKATALAAVERAGRSRVKRH